MKFAVRLSNFGRNTGCGAVGIDEGPKTYSTKRNGRELSEAFENAIFYEEIPRETKVPNKWLLFA